MCVCVCVRERESVLCVSVCEQGCVCVCKEECVCVCMKESYPLFQNIFTRIGKKFKETSIIFPFPIELLIFLNKLFQTKNLTRVMEKCPYIVSSRRQLLQSPEEAARNLARGHEVPTIKGSSWEAVISVEEVWNKCCYWLCYVCERMEQLLCRQSLWKLT